MPALAGPASPTRHRRGDGLALAGDSGDEPEAVASAGAGSHPTATAGDRNQINYQEVTDVWPQYRCWQPLGWGWHKHGWSPPYAWQWWPPSREEETAMLEEQAKALERGLQSISKRIEELTKEKEEVKNA